MNAVTDKIMTKLDFFRQLFGHKITEADSSFLERIDQIAETPKKDDILAFSCVRNELLRLPFFLEYHRNLGIDSFFIVDNNSTDGTTEYLLSQPDCYVFFTKGSYGKSNCGMNWIHQLLEKYGTNHWIATLEPDEMLIYPLSESVKLRTLTAYLDSKDDHAMKTFLIDMYSNTTIKETNYRPQDSFLDHCNYFDSTGYYDLDDDGIPKRGGARDRLFWQKFDRKDPPPYLINISLVKWKEDLRYAAGAGTHILPDVKTSVLIGCKLHFKFFSDFHSSAEQETKRKEHWNNASEYAVYREVIRKNPNLSAMYKKSMKYKSTQQLVGLGIMKMPDDFIIFVDEY